MEPKVTELHAAGNPPLSGTGASADQAHENVLCNRTQAVELPVDQSLSP
jgi:hypothetical protein